MAGRLRIPLIVRWPHHVTPGRVSDDIVDVTDLFSTLIRAGGGELPTDRPIDGIDHMDWWAGGRERSRIPAVRGFSFISKASPEP